ncbi:SDR family oxidoreductase [Alteromonas lipolytica]|uniref:Short-chain dehydrogenase n=1 Tax=Alteromonas lipolytica TaxID=1856405 RepID=A0A1E8FHM7_9ALTE|nr:SDR family oxidoreductase [Alteromonas lipolytica]OFI35440.1 short-chain dehydrogenase [Alteromonas lipolytica]GGF76268.1 short-chain dehydrogenase/reductase [Alteromonas lipolytica]
MSQRLLGKVAIVTGAAMGIGAEVARTYAKEGAKLALFDMRYDDLQTLKAELVNELGTQVLTYQVDVGNADVVTKSIDDVVATFGQIDILVNNAGTNVFNNILNLSDADWERCISVNLMGALNCCKAAIRHMLTKSYGNIVNIASVHAHKIVKGAFPYTISKHAIIGLSRSLAIEYADQGIRVNSISPGLIDTPLAKSYFDSCEDAEAEREKQRQIIPVKRFGQPEEVAQTALFLGSDEARFINATDILIDGGRSQVYCD